MRISKRTRVFNLREIWPLETNLSDWLASEPGLDLIAEDLGIVMQDPVRECRPGDFPCDIVGKLAGEEKHPVIIENQFGKTNHDHLGKLLTYAAMNSAMTAIWIAETVSDDHRRTVDWLNTNTPPDISFYLVQIKVYQIEDSPVAPQLDVMCRPNLEEKIQHGSGDQELKNNNIWFKQYWEDILSYIKEQSPPYRVQSQSSSYWTYIPLKRNFSNFSIELKLVPSRRCIGCQLLVHGEWKEAAYNQLFKQKVEIEAELGTSLDWLPLNGSKRSRIDLEIGIDPKIEANRQQVKEWMYGQATAFYRVFQPRILALTPPADYDDIASSMESFERNSYDADEETSG